MDNNTIIISICAPWNEKKEYPLPDSNRVLNVDFDDMDPRCLKLEDGTEVFDDDTNYIQFITYAQVEKMVDFIEKNKDKNIAAQGASIKESEKYKELGKRSPSKGMFYSEYLKPKNKRYGKNH